MAATKGIAQTLQDVLNNLQKQLKEKTVALDAANKKIASLSGGQGGDFTVELDAEKEKLAQAQNQIKEEKKEAKAETSNLKKQVKEAKAEISNLKKQVSEASLNGSGDSSTDLTLEIEQRTQVEGDLAARTAELLEMNKKLLAETQARMKVEAELSNAGQGGGGIPEAEHQKEITLREKAELDLQEAQSQLQEVQSQLAESQSQLIEAGQNQGQGSKELAAAKKKMATLVQSQESLAQEKSDSENSVEQNTVSAVSGTKSTGTSWSGDQGSSKRT